MIEKTSSSNFKEYGEVYYEPVNLEKFNLLCKQMRTIDKTITHLFCFTCDVYIELFNGLASILIGTQPQADNLKLFAIHHNIKIKANTYFNIIPLSDETSCYLITPENYELHTEFIKPYTYKPIIPRLNILEMLGYYYVVKGPNYRFKGEKHNYYELTYVDYGSLDTTVDDDTYTLHTHDLLIYGPGQFHTQQIIENTSCSYLTVVFDMEIDNPAKILNKVFHCSSELHSILRKFVKESASELPYSKTLMLCYLQEIIILLVQSNLEIEIEKEPTKLGNVAIQHFQDELLQEILTYMNEMVTEPITIEEICHKFSISRSSLQSLFKTHLKDSPKNYLINIKLQKSKELIRENRYTISEIAFTLGFSSIHYFSRLFKQHFNIPPSEYAKKIYRN